jgi:D-alanine-D-alanine ligase
LRTFALRNARCTMSTERPLIAVFRGGYSGESVISHQSAARMMAAIDLERYDPLFVTIEKDRWSCSTPQGSELLLDRGRFSVTTSAGERRFQAALIAVHGSPGEDGLLQGYLDMLGVPYQTGGVLTMALTFSKFASTALLREQGFAVAPSILLRAHGARPDPAALPFGYPCFVKPDQSGSSLGVSKVARPEDLDTALNKAFLEGDAVMIEAAVKGRELTCGVLIIGHTYTALPVCEITTSREFFDYEAKYHAADTVETIPADLPPQVTVMVQERSVAIAKAMDCKGMVRVDHFWTGSDLVTIEINTVPGFTNASIYPKMLEVCGIEMETALGSIMSGMLN